MAERRPRRTAAQLRADIHAAIVTALVEDGYGAITFEGVARRCGVSKPVLYRRYADRAAMVIDALGASARSGPSASATGLGTDTLRAGLITRFESAHERAATIGIATYRGLVGEADLAVLQDLAGIGAATARELLDQVIGPAQERGELGPDTIPDTILLAPLRVLRDQMIFEEMHVDIPALIDDVALPLYRAASGADRRHRRLQASPE